MHFTVDFKYEVNRSKIESYSKVDIYACRLYNKVLTDEEIKDNYNATVTYHNMLIQNEK